MNKKILISLFFFSHMAFANPTSVGRITEVSGSGFISQNGATHEIKKGELIYVNSEIVVEHNGRVSFTDNADHRFHVGNSSSVAILKNGLQLRSGDVWIQSLNRNDNYKLMTANAVVEFQNGEAIVTYDTSKGKTQLMVINGMMKLANFRVPDLNLSVSEGNFSYVDNAYEEGAPRDPTPAGVKTYNALITEFKGVRPLDVNAEKVMAAASHETIAATEAKHEEKHKEAKHMEAAPATHEAKREIASTHEVVKHEDKLLDEYKNSMLEKKSHKTVSKTKKVVYSKPSNKAEVKATSPLVVQIFGLKKIETTTHESVATHDVVPGTRKPASVEEPAGVVEKKVNTELKEENKPVVPSKETEKLLEQIKNL